MKKTSKILLSLLLVLILSGVVSVFTACNKSYTVKFDLGGGTATIPNQTITSGQKATRPTAVPTKNNFTFDNWYESKEENAAKFNFDKAITADTTVYAKYTAIAPAKFAVNFITGEGGSTVAAQEVTSGGYATIPATNPTREGFTFTGWFTAAGGTTAFNFATTAITAETNIYAGWQAEGPAKFAVNFITGTGGSTVASQEVTTGEFATIPAINPTKEGYTFTGWFTEEGGTTVFNFTTTAITAETNIYAGWEAEETGEPGEGEPGIGEAAPRTANFTTTRNNKSKLSVAAAGTSVNQNLNTAGTNNLNMNNGIVGNSIAANQNTAADSRNTTNNNTNTNISTNNMNNNNMRNTTAANYGLNYILGEGGTGVQNTTAMAGSYARKPLKNPVRQGYKFNGWFNEADAKTSFNFENTAINSETNIYAGWTSESRILLDAVDKLLNKGCTVTIDGSLTIGGETKNFNGITLTINNNFNNAMDSKNDTSLKFSGSDNLTFSDSNDSTVLKFSDNSDSTNLNLLNKNQNNNVSMDYGSAKSTQMSDINNAAVKNTTTNNTGMNNAVNNNAVNNNATTNATTFRGNTATGFNDTNEDNANYKNTFGINRQGANAFNRPARYNSGAVSGEDRARGMMNGFKQRGLSENMIKDLFDITSGNAGLTYRLKRNLPSVAASRISDAGQQGSFGLTINLDENDNIKEIYINTADKGTAESKNSFANIQSMAQNSRENSAELNDRNNIVSETDRAFRKTEARSNIDNADKIIFAPKDDVFPGPRGPKTYFPENGRGRRMPRNNPAENYSVLDNNVRGANVTADNLNNYGINQNVSNNAEVNRTTGNANYTGINTMTNNNQTGVNTISNNNQVGVNRTTGNNNQTGVSTMTNNNQMGANTIGNNNTGVNNTSGNTNRIDTVNNVDKNQDFRLELKFSFYDPAVNSSVYSNDYNNNSFSENNNTSNNTVRTQVTRDSAASGYRDVVPFAGGTR